MKYKEQDAATWRRGDTVKVVRLTGHRVAASASSEEGFTLIELVITIVVLTILSLGIIPLVKVSVKRQKEQQLRDALREMRLAVDQFHREALAGSQYQANQQPQPPIPGGEPPSGRPTNPNQPQPNIFGDPRVRVMITDQTLFTA